MFQHTNTLVISFQRIGDNRPPASHLACAAAVASLHHVLPPLVIQHPDVVAEALRILCTHLPHDARGDDAARSVAGAIQFHHGVGLGLALASLVREKFFDVSSDELTMQFTVATSSLTKSAQSGSDSRYFNRTITHSPLNHTSTTA